MSVCRVLWVGVRHGCGHACGQVSWVWCATVAGHLLEFEDHESGSPWWRPRGSGRSRVSLFSFCKRGLGFRTHTARRPLNCPFVCGLSSLSRLIIHFFFRLLEDFFTPSPINAPDAALRRAEIPLRRKSERAPCCRSACLSSG